MNDPDSPDGFGANAGSQRRAHWFERTLRRIPSILQWDGLLPLVSPMCTLATLRAPHILQSMAVSLVPMVIALVRAKIGKRQLARACGDAGDSNRQLALGAAIVLLLGLEIFSSALILGKGNELWILVAVLYVGYLGCISYALRPPRMKTQRLWELRLDALVKVALTRTDTFGAPERWLIAEFRDGTKATFESAKDKAAFLFRLHQHCPDLVRDIADAIAAEDQPANFERIWTVEEKKPSSGDGRVATES
jgi:hypothetical protein